MRAKVFQSGNSQAVRLPKAFRFDVAEVEIFRRGDEVVLRPRVEDLGVVFDLLTSLPEDMFDEGRQDAAPQERESW